MLEAIPISHMLPSRVSVSWISVGFSVSVCLSALLCPSLHPFFPSFLFSFFFSSLCVLMHSVWECTCCRAEDHLDDRWQVFLKTESFLCLYVVDPSSQDNELREFLLPLLPISSIFMCSFKIGLGHLNSGPETCVTSTFFDNCISQTSTLEGICYLQN